MTPFSYPSGATDAGKWIVKPYNNCIEPSSQSEWDKLYEHVHQCIQKEIIQLAAHMGDECSFIINVGKAIYDARSDRNLSRFGYKLQRAQNNTHLSEGIPMYIASLCYAYVLTGIRPEDVKFYPLYSKDAHLTGDRGNTVRTNIRNTPKDAERARKCAWNACIR